MIGNYHGHLPNAFLAQKDVQHTLSFKKGSFIASRHNHIRNVSAVLFSQVTKDVKIEPVLQSLTAGTFEQREANTSNNTLLDL